MYYEEQWIEGALCWRTSPYGAWTRYTANELAHRYESAEKRAADAQATVEALQARVNGLEKDSELLRQSRDDFRVKYESVKNDAITLQAQLTQRTAELEAAKTRAHESESKATEFSVKLQQAREERDNLRLRIQAVDKEHEQLAVDRQKMTGTVESLLTERDNLRAELERVRGERDRHLERQVEALRAQLPAEMQECTILFKECEKGHGRLTATNWIDHGCQTCAMEAVQRVRDEFERERDQLHAALMEAKAALADAEREKVKGLHEITKVICTHCCEPMEIPSKAVLQTQLSQLQDWRDQVTLALQRAGGARFEDVPGHVKTVVDDLTQLQALVRAKEAAYEKILLSRERLEREMRGYPPVDNEGIPMVWQEPVGWVKRHPGRHDASTY